ncbi:carbon-nitrogen hydrolase family protein [Vibrio salinus]|uniref:carbon-nitrogen hydrolase family protein n=1 Tax=Vibrio salinus TaxID=2899784 RepID=UPI001E5D6AB8|nr:carbon-nitrogen hydrolase family protein [Vibrio salinus]MCE0493136.1 carbon-nitrogen hydrolase family protein [Vibrio salinus]
MKVAAIQMNSGDVVENNVSLASSLIRDAVSQGCEFVVLPEYFCLMGVSDQTRLALGEAFGNGPVQTAMSVLAKECGVWIAAGTIPILSGVPDKVLNSQLLFDPDGNCVNRYDKVHLFNFDNGEESYREADVLTAGKDIRQFELAQATVRPSICYDLRFPEFYRYNCGYEILTVSAAFTYTTGQAHWEVLLRSRAIENQCYVIASAQTGIHPNGRKTFGHSMIIDPWGNILALQEEDNGVVIADMDIPALQRIRQQLPALQNRVFY